MVKVVWHSWYPHTLFRLRLPPIAFVTLRIAQRQKSTGSRPLSVVFVHVPLTLTMEGQHVYVAAQLSVYGQYESLAEMYGA